MATIKSPWVGAAKGKLGEAVYYRSQGQTRARSLAGSVKNPQALGQMMTRIALTTASRAYSVLSPLANHAFQNFEYGAKNQNRFMKLNIALLRAKQQVAPAVRLSAFNFNEKEQFSGVANDYYISEGNLPVVPVEFVQGGDEDRGLVPGITAEALLGANPTYQQVCDALGLPAGAQLTFVITEGDGTEEDGGIIRALHYARVILMPSDGDMTSPFIVEGAINKPNTKNEGALTLLNSVDSGIAFSVDAVDKKVITSATVIASAYENGKWRRSTQQMVVNVGTDNVGTELWYPAYQSYLPSASTSESDRYLNEGE